MDLQGLYLDETFHISAAGCIAFVGASALHLPEIYVTEAYVAGTPLPAKQLSACAGEVRATVRGSIPVPCSSGDSIQSVSDSPEVRTPIPVGRLLAHEGRRMHPMISRRGHRCRCCLESSD